MPPRTLLFWGKTLVKWGGIEKGYSDLLEGGLAERGGKGDTGHAIHCIQYNVERGIIQAVQEVTKVIVPLLESYHQAKLTIERNKPHRAALEAEEHLARLTPSGFLTVTEWNRLLEYPRYFRAVPIRFEKLRSGGEAMDSQNTLELSKYWQKYLERRELHELAGIVDSELEVFRWMLEEYRVSLFAQKLGTSIKVSPQRLDKQFEKIQR